MSTDNHINTLPNATLVIDENDDTCNSLATEQILRYDDQDRNVDATNIIARLRQDLTHERQLRKDIQSQLRQTTDNYEELRRKNKDLGLQVNRSNTEIIANRHEKTHMESRNQELAADVNKFSEKIDYYKSQSSTYKSSYDKEYKMRVQNEEAIMDLKKQIELLNSQLDSNHLEKRSRLIAEEQYRSAILERDRNIKRLSNEIDQLTNRLSESSKMTNGIRREKSSKDEEIMRLTSELKKSKICFDKSNEDFLDLKKSHNKTLSEMSALRRNMKDLEEEAKQSNANYKKKIEELEIKEKEKRILLDTMSEFKAKQTHREARFEERQMLTDNEIFANKEALRIAREQSAQFQTELSELKAKHKVQSKAKSNEIADLEAKLRHIQEKEVRSLNDRITNLTVEQDKTHTEKKLALKKLKKERAGTEDRIANAQKEADTYKNRVSTLEPLIERLSFKVDELASDRTKLIERINDLENENLRLSKELSTVAFTNGEATDFLSPRSQANLRANQTSQNGRLNSGLSESRHKLNSLRKREGHLSDELGKTQSELQALMKSLRKTEHENSIYFNTISELQNNKLSLETKIIKMQEKDKSHLDTLSKMTYKADEIAKDAQRFAMDEQKRSSNLNVKYMNVCEKLREADLEIERLRKQAAVDNAIKSLQY